MAIIYTKIDGQWLLEYSSEPTNASIRYMYAVAVIKKGTTIGHLLQKIFKVRSIFMRSDGIISCKVTESRHFLNVRVRAPVLISE